MKLESQVVSLELAKRLKELGVKQESIFYWTAYENPPHGILKESNVPNDLWTVGSPLQKYFGNHDYDVSAFTVAELGEMLPVRFIYAQKLPDGWRYEYNIANGYGIHLKNEADARAKMLVYLIENGLVKP